MKTIDFKKLIFIGLLVSVASCSWMDDILNNEDTTKPVTTYDAYQCKDDGSPASEKIESIISKEDLQHIVDYLKTIIKSDPNNLASNISIHQILDDKTKDTIETLAQEALQKSLVIAAKDDVLKDRMHLDYYRQLYLKFFLDIARKSSTSNCYQFLFYYRYSVIEDLQNEIREFKTNLTLLLKDSGILLACTIAEALKTAYCKDESSTTGLDGGGASGDSDSDWDDWDD